MHTKRIVVKNVKMYYYIWCNSVLTAILLNFTRFNQDCCNSHADFNKIGWTHFRSFFMWAVQFVVSQLLYIVEFTKLTKNGWKM